MAEEKPTDTSASDPATEITTEQFLEKVAPGADGAGGGGQVVKFGGDQIAQVIIVPKGTEYPMPGADPGSHMAGEQMMSEEQNLSKIKELETQLSDSTKKVSEIEAANVKLSEENKKLSEDNSKLAEEYKKLSDELAVIKQAEIDGLVGNIVDIRLAKGLTDADKVEETKVSLKKLPAEYLKIILSDLTKIADKIPMIQKPKATDVQLSANDEETTRMKLFGHKKAGGD